MFTARLAWGGCSVSTHLHSQSVMQEQATPLCPALLPSLLCMCLCAHVRVCVLSCVHGGAGWSRVVCVKGCDIKVFWSLPPLSSAMSPFICEAHFISLPPSSTPSLSSTFFFSSTDATCSSPHSSVSCFVHLSTHPGLHLYVCVWHSLHQDFQNC